MPGELLLEMARAAAVLTVKETAAVRLTHIVWSKPILTEAEPFHIEIRLIPAEGEAKRFEIYNPFSADSSHYDVYSQGTIQPVDAVPGMLDISRLKENSGSLMDKQQIEAITQNDTVQYSEHMKGIERIYASAGRMLADISIPLTNQKESARFGLPPCVMQSVTEACALLGGKEYKTLAPVSLDELLFYESCPDKVWAEIQEKAGSFYIDLCDEEGKIWASLSGLKLQPVIKTGAPGKTNAEHRSERLYEQTLLQLKTLFGLTAKIAVSSIDTEEPLETYGINSVTVTKLNRELSLLFGDLSKTVFTNIRHWAPWQLTLSRIIRMNAENGQMMMSTVQAYQNRFWQMKIFRCFRRLSSERNGLLFPMRNRQKKGLRLSASADVIRKLKHLKRTGIT